MPALDKPDQDAIYALLAPFMGTEPERRAHLLDALATNHPLERQIAFEGPADTFTLNLIHTLEQYGEIAPGKPALWALLEVIRRKVGVDKKQRIDSLRPAFQLPPPPIPDRVFVSYSRKNSAFALRLVSELSGSGLRVWFDRAKIRGGEEWWRSIEQGIALADFVILCLSPDSARSEVAQREIITARAKEKLIVPVMLEPCLELLKSSEFESIRWLADLHILDFSTPEQFGKSYLDLLKSLPGFSPPDEYYEADPEKIINPYRGLEAFQERDSSYFIGRETETEELLRRLRGDKRLLAVVGASGSGKSSLVRAGLIPQIHSASDHLALWQVMILIPRSSPLQTLAESFSQRLEVSTESLYQQLRSRPEALSSVVHDLLRGMPEGARCLLVIDQFEEVFASPEAGAFVALITHALLDSEGQTRIVLTMRSDFFERLSAYPEFAQQISDNLFIVGELSPEALRRTIEVPARRAQLRFEEGLVDQILEEVRAQPGSLPLLQYALKELTERREGFLLSRGAYERIGGVQGALTTRADQIYDSLSEAQQRLMRRLLLRLVEVGKDTVTRRRAERAELRFEDVPEAEVQAVLDRLTHREARLLTVSAPIGDADHSDDSQVLITLSHEALIRSWGRFQEWIESSQEALRLEAALRRAEQEWITSAQDSAFLLRGSRLTRAREWLQSADSPPQPLKVYIEASSEFRRAEIEADERRTRALQEAQAQEEKARQEAQQERLNADAASQQANAASNRALMASRRATLARRLLMIVGLLAGGIAFAAFLSVSNARQQVSDANATLVPVSTQIVEAEKRLEQTESRRLALLALEQLNRDPVNSIHLALASLAELVSTSLPEARFALNEALRNAFERAYAPTHLYQGAAGDFDLPQDQKFAFYEETPSETDYLATAGSPLTLISYNGAGLGPMALPEAGAAQWRSVHWSDRGRLMAYGDEAMIVWRSLSQPPVQYPSQGGRIGCGAWQPGAERIAVCDDRNIVLWNPLDTSAPLLDALILDGPVVDLRWSPDGQALAAWDESKLMIWQGGSAAVYLAFGIDAGDGSEPRGFFWFPDGRNALVAFGDQAYIITLGYPERPPIPLENSPNISEMLPLQDEHFLTLSEDGQVKLWRRYRILTLDLFGLKAELLSSAPPLHRAIPSPDGSLILITSDLGQPLIWPVDLERPAPIQIPARSGVIQTGVWLNDSILATAQDDGVIHVWRAERHRTREIMRLYGHTMPVIGLIPVGDRHLLSVGRDNSVRLWLIFDADGYPLCDASLLGETLRCRDGGGSRIQAIIPEFSGNVLDVRWLPDGRLILNTPDGMARLITPGSDLIPFGPAEYDPDRRVRFSPDSSYMFTYGGAADSFVWEVGETAPLTTLPTEISAAHWLQSGLIAVQGSDLRLFSGVDFTEVKNLGSAGELYAAAEDDGLVVTVDSQFGLRVWDGRTWEVVFSEDQNDPQVSARLFLNDVSLSFSPDGRWLIERRSAITGEGLVAVRDTLNWQIDWMTSNEQPDPACPADDFRQALFSPDGVYLAVAADTLLCVWDWHTRALRDQQTHEDRIAGIQWSQDSQRLLIWDLAGDGVVRDVSARIDWLHLDDINALTGAVFRPDEGQIATIGFSGRVILWDTNFDPRQAQQRADLCCRTRPLPKAQFSLIKEDLPR